MDFIYALNNGAKEVHSLDSSKKAIDLLEKNIALINNKNIKHKSIVADAMEYIKDINEDYDIIILDPPAFAKHMSAKHKAIQGYKRLNSRAIEKIKPGGIIFTFSCSQLQLLVDAITCQGEWYEARRLAVLLPNMGRPAAVVGGSH